MDLWSVAVFIAVAMVALEIAAVLRRGVGNHRGYFALLLLDAGLLLHTFSRLSTEEAGPWPELVAGVVLCGLIVLVPAVIERAIRRALAGERVTLAARLASVKEVLQPGRAATAERELYGELGRVRAGRVDEVVRALRARLVEAEPPEDAHLHDRIITALAYGRRFRDAATHYETHVHTPPELHPGLAIQMVRAYGELGELHRAAGLVHRLETAAREREPGALAALAQARLFFLAYAGGESSVERLLALPALRRIPPRLGELLREAARARAGAETPPEVARFAAQAAERAVADADPPRAAVAPRPWATLALVAANLAAFVLFLVAFGDFESGYGLVRAGGSLHVAVRAGEWWRLWTAMFMHGGFVHLVLNMAGLYLLGRILEPLFGWIRLTVIYCAAGLVGNLVSVYNPRPEAVLSIGASGAVMGLMGALLVVLLLWRDVWHERLRRTMLIDLPVLLVVQLGLGSFLRVVDNFAHIGGLVGGALVAALVLPRRGPLGRGRFGRAAVIALLAGLAASATASVVALARERVPATLGRVTVEQRVGPALMAAPSYAQRSKPEEPDWPGQESLADEVSSLTYAPHVVSLDGASLPAALARCLERDKATVAKQAHDGKPAPALAPVDAPPIPGWTGIAQRETPAGGGPGQDLLYYGRALDDKRALVVEATWAGRPPIPAFARDALARALAGTRLAP